MTVYKHTSSHAYHTRLWTSWGNSTLCWPVSPSVKERIDDYAPLAKIPSVCLLLKFTPNSCSPLVHPRPLLPSLYGKTEPPLAFSSSDGCLYKGGFRVAKISSKNTSWKIHPASSVGNMKIAIISSSAAISHHMFGNRSEYRRAGATVTQLMTVACPTTLPATRFSDFFLLICWMLWKHRNAVVFDRSQPSHQGFWQSGRDEARL